jgi:hypothetical protein
VSTRAIVTATNGNETYRIYCHGDGYPAGLGQLVKYFTNIAPAIDPNSGFSKYKSFRVNPKTGKEDYKYSPYGSVPNAAGEPNKYIAALLGYLWKKGYTHAYLTDRNPVEEAKNDWSDIEWHYVVNLGDRGKKPSLKVYRKEYTGEGPNMKGHFVELPNVEWESYDGKTPYWVERKQHEAAEKKRKATGLKVPAVKPRAKKLRVINTSTGALLYGLKRSRR